MPMYKHTADISSGLEFPLDMLRYDQCYPDRGEDASRMATQDPEAPIRVATVRNTRIPPWTDGRWRSFGCTVKHVDTWKL
jgi:hypothetical protein